ncbi:MAG: hypothetical protein GYB49_09310 [Alphaproteobacteria bacterium]|nr:hypothetical protein [Alphaproteobacteria bacterium]
MASYTPCTQCPMNPCARKEAVQKQMRGAPVTAVRIRCPDYRNLFTPGQRVSVYLKYAGDYDDGYHPSDVDGVMGTVIGRSGRKWLVYIDQDEQEHLRLQNEAGVVKLWPSAITADDDGCDPVEKLLPLARNELCAGIDHGADPETYIRQMGWVK